MRARAHFNFHLHLTEFAIFSRCCQMDGRISAVSSNDNNKNNNKTMQHTHTHTHYTFRFATLYSVRITLHELTVSLCAPISPSAE